MAGISMTWEAGGRWMPARALPQHVAEFVGEARGGTLHERFAGRQVRLLRRADLLRGVSDHHAHIPPGSCWDRL